MMSALHRPPGSAAGFSLVEMMAAMVISVIAIMGIAHTFSLGTGFIDRYATARAALARANGHLEHVRAQVKGGVQLANAVSSTPILLAPGLPASLNTRIEGVGDDADGSDGSSDYYRVTTSVIWTQAGMRDSIQLNTVMLQP
jgi:prepilin-type N-terminal cleavage/methylation domain-containing protein